MSRTYQMKAGSTQRDFQSTATYGGTALDVSGTTVTLVIKNVHTGAVVEISGSGTSAGVLTATPTAEQVNAPGRYQVEWHVTFADGRTLRLPEDDYLILDILGALS